MGNLLRNATHYTDAGASADPRRAWFQRQRTPGRASRKNNANAFSCPSFAAVPAFRARRRPGLGLLVKADLRGRGLERNPQRGGAATAASFEVLLDVA